MASPVSPTPPAPGAASSHPPPQPVLTMEKLLEKERVIQAKAAELQRRERDVILMLKKTQPNWPFTCLCITPIVYHDIVSELPPERVRFCKMAYTNYFCTIVLLLYNVACAVATMTAKGKELENNEEDETEYGKHMGIAILQLLGIVFAFVVWYYPTYKACGERTKNQYRMAYVGICVAFLYDLLMAVGFSGYGGCGWLFTLNAKQMKESMTPYYMCMACSILWCIQAVFFLWMFARVRKYAVRDMIKRLQDEAAANATRGNASGRSVSPSHAV